MNQPSDQDYAKVTLQFLNRVDLKGNEVPSFNAVVAWLHSKAELVSQEADEE